ALNKRYNYKLFFVLRANNRGVDDAEVEMMVKLSECVRQKDGSKVPFGVFINQIQSQQVLDMYQEKVIKDNFFEFFNSLKGKKPTTDVEIDCVIPFWFDEDGIENFALRDTVAKAIASHKAIQLRPNIQIILGKTKTEIPSPSLTKMKNNNSSLTKMKNNNSSPSQENTIAILFIGHSGAGKSTLLSQLGGNFESGVKFRAGYTTDIYETRAMVNGEEVILMDVPGLFEPDDEKTKHNASKLTEALKRGYRYMLYFVLKANNRGPPEEEMVMMSKVNECVRQAGSKATYRIIVNQIQSKEVYDMYAECVALDNCESLFKSMNMEEFSFDITVTGVLMFMYDEKAVEGYQFRSKLEEDIQKHQPALLSLKRDIEVSNKDVKLFTMAAMNGMYLGCAIGVAAELSPAGAMAFGSMGAVVSGAAFLAYSIYKSRKNNP
ncbi:hypothetical protein BGX27_005496, partial [Mortierella sp. AM989]